MIFRDLSDDEYGKRLGAFICNIEVHPDSELVKSGRYLKPYADNSKNADSGSIAIGYGLDLKKNATSEITKLYQGVFGNGWQLTKEELSILRDYKNGTITTSMALRKFNSLSNLSLNLKTSDNAYKLFYLTSKKYDDKINKYIPKSYERLALVSRAYNHYGEGIRSAVSQKDRFLIWFHLRYTINTQQNVEQSGLTKRRLWESDIFDLKYKDDFEAIINIFSHMNISKHNDRTIAKYIRAYEGRNFTEKNITDFKADAVSRKLNNYFLFKHNKIDATLAPFVDKLHSLLKEVINTTFDNKNIYVVYLKSDGTNNISAINKALQEREKNSEFKEGKKEEILLIYPHQSAQPTAPYQPKNTRLTIILASGNYLDCSNLNPSGNSSESRLILTNYKFNSYKTNYNASNIKFINPFTSKETILYKDEVGNFISQDKKYSYNSANKIVLNFFDNLNFNLLNFAKENGSLRSDKASSMFDIKLKLASNNSSVPTTNNGNFNLVITNLIITDENQNSTDIKEIYLHNGEDKRVYKSYYLKKNETTSDDELEKNSYTAKFNINLILDKNQGAFKKTTKFILAARDLSKDYSTSEIHSMSDNGVVSLEANQKQSGQATYELKTSLIDIANNIFNVTVDVPNKKDRTTITTKDTINLKAKYKPNKGDDNYKEINWSYKIIKKDEYNGEVRANIVINDIKLEGEKFKGKEINFTPQTDIKDQELLEKLKEDDSTIVFFACLKAPRYTTRYGKTHGIVDFKVPMKLKYENNKLYIYEFGHTNKSLGFDASLSDKFSCEINEAKKSTNSGGKYYVSSSINSQSIGIFKDHKLKEPAYQVISNNGKSSRVPFEIYVADVKTKNTILGNKGGINLINNENKNKFISKFNEIKQKVKLENGESIGVEIIEDDVCFCLSQGLVKKSCGGNGCNINDNDYATTAKDLGVEKEVLMAIASQESKHTSFKAVKQATILFERHKMYWLLIKKGYTKASVDALSKKYPSIVNKSDGGYNDMTSYEKLKIAKSIDYSCAVQSCSWGKFQVMGLNYANLYSSPMELEKAMNMCELQQFKYFVSYLKNTSGMVDALKNKNWERIATLYNGPKWKDKNPEYANNIKRYYNQFKVSK